jgi:hypothetical protein
MIFEIKLYSHIAELMNKLQLRSLLKKIGIAEIEIMHVEFHCITYSPALKNDVLAFTIIM